MAQIRKRDLVRIFIRSFYIQGTWNTERLLGLGFCFCLIPVAQRLFNDKTELTEFLQRHLEFFNSHPYLATYALGAIANIEQQAISKKWEDKRPITVFKNRIVGPLGAIGDTLFWQLIRPAIGLLGVVLLSIFGTLGTIAYLIAYNIPHFYIRIRGLIKSYLKGFDIVRDLSLRGTQRYFITLKYLFSALFGIEIVILIHFISVTEFSWKGTIIFLISMITTYFLTRRQRVSIDMLIITVICTSIILGLII